ncbi:MAG: hypothetical protein IIA72_16185 [Proteobacteria bacterium]|nr:hypothetical protein [Pseudomonadota bacterium]
MLIVVTLFCVGLGGWHHYVEPFRKQRRLSEEIQELGGTIRTAGGGPAWMREIFGDWWFQEIVYIDLCDSDVHEVGIARIAALPRLETLLLGGLNVTDADLAQIETTESLRTVILDTTAVSDEAAAQFRSVRPDVLLRSSQRRAIAALGSAVMAGFVGDKQLRDRFGEEHFKDVYSDVGCIFQGNSPNQGSYNFPYHTPVDLDVVIPILRHQPHIEVVGFYHMPLNDRHLEQLSFNPNIRELELDETKVTDAGLIHLRNFKRLESLSLFGTSIAVRNAAKFADYCPYEDH